jgi:hypothetical protein
MAAFKMFINCDNDAFGEVTYDKLGRKWRDQIWRVEIARILREIADRVEFKGEGGGFYETIRDINGNDCGRFSLKENDRAYTNE